jgi:hypothetical protein
VIPSGFTQTEGPHKGQFDASGKLFKILKFLSFLGKGLKKLGNIIENNRLNYKLPAK